MILNLQNEFDFVKYDKFDKEARTERGVYEIKKIHPCRTLSQNKYLHLILGYFASEFGYSTDEVKFDIFKRQINPDLFITTRKGKRCNREGLRSSRDLTTAEMTVAIERFRNYSASVCGFYIPSPEERDLIIFARQQVEQYNEYL